jgi:hypothetical protein
MGLYFWPGLSRVNDKVCRPVDIPAKDFCQAKGSPPLDVRDFVSCAGFRMSICVIYKPGWTVAVLGKNKWGWYRRRVSWCLGGRVSVHACMHACIMM